MEPDRIVHRLCSVYALLLRLYPEDFRRRFAEPMAQTFRDLCRERRVANGALFSLAAATFAETCGGILRERMASSMLRRKTILRPALITVALLSVPLVAMQFSEGVDWSPFDFVAMGVLLFGTGFAFELIAGRARNTAYRAAVGLGLITGFLLIWVNLAVGFIGSEDNPANALYLGVLMVGAVGAAVARLRARGMSRALFATALAQFLVPPLAMLIWGPNVGDEVEADAAGLVQVLFLNAFFVLLFVGSGALFREAGAAEQQKGSVGA